MIPFKEVLLCQIHYIVSPKVCFKAEVTFVIENINKASVGLSNHVTKEQTCIKHICVLMFTNLSEVHEE